MIELILNLLVITQASAVALGVGSSTIVITSFLVALADGKIDPSERRMLGVIYVTLRVAMVGILLTTSLIVSLNTYFFGELSPYLFLLISVLFANAILMTKHWISPKVGPALQAATWYTLGFMLTIHMFELFPVGHLEFAGLYLFDIVFALLAVNGVMYFMKKRQGKTTDTKENKK